MTFHGPTHTAWDRNLSHLALVPALLVMAAQIMQPSPWLSLYPRMHLMPSGLVVTAGQVPEIRTWNPANGRWNDVGSTSIYRSFGTSVLLPLQNSLSERGRVLIVGGSATDTTPATTSVEMLDFKQGTASNPVIHSANSITYGRKLLCPTILPNGKVLMIRGFFTG